MGKKLMSALLAGALALSMCGTALAAGNTVANDKMTITGCNGVSITFTESENPEKLDSIVYTDSNLVANNYYVLLMVKGTEDEYGDNLNVNGILFIDQAQAIQGNDGKVSVTFNNVYPSSILNSVLLIAGANNGPIVAAIIEGKYILGDVDNSGEVDIGDAMFLLQVLAGIRENIPEDDPRYQVADYDGSGVFDIGDAMSILKYLASST